MNGASEIADDELQRIIDDFDAAAYSELKQSRRDRPWVRDLIAVLGPRTTGIDMDELVRTLWQMREKTLPMPKAFRNTVQSRLNHYTRQSAVYWSKSARPEDDLFYSPKGKGSGTWAVHRDRAAAWLKRKNLPPK